MAKKKNEIEDEIYDADVLQKDERARPYCLLSSIEKQVLKEAGLKNVIVLKNGKWTIPKTKGFIDDATYILQKSYSSKYEWLSVIIKNGDLCDMWEVTIDQVIRNPRFRGFWFHGQRISIDMVAEKHSISHEVLIRLAK